MSNATIRDFQSDEVESDISIRRFIQNNLPIREKRLRSFQSHDRSNNRIFKYSDIQEAANVKKRETANQSVESNQKDFKTITENRVAINSKRVLQKRVYQNSDDEVDHRAHNYRALRLF